MSKFFIFFITLTASFYGFSQDYIIENAVKRKNDNLRTFSIPRAEKRNNVQNQQMVKLIFTDKAGHSERMWVFIQKKVNGTYIGELDNNPVDIKSLKLGDSIKFKADHIIDIWKDHDQIPYGQYILIDEAIFDQKLWPKFALKTKSAEAGDSGWKISTKSMQSNQNFKNFHKIEVESVLDYFTFLDTILEEPEPKQWVWDDKKLEYKTLK